MNGQGNKSDLFNDLLIISLFNVFIGKKFWNNGNRYEGEWKDDTMHGQGKKSDLFNDSLILILFNDFIGKFFWKSGGRYEGEWKFGARSGKGKKSYLFNDLLILILFNVVKKARCSITMGTDMKESGHMEQ